MSEPANPVPEANAPHRGGRSPLRSPFWIAFILLILVLALATTYAALRGLAQLARQTLPEKSVVTLIINGTPHNLSEQSAAELFPKLTASLAASAQRLGEAAAVEIDRSVDAAFAPAIDNIPRYADWYYSLPGEYSRYAAALGGDVAGYMLAQFHALVLRPAKLEEQVDEIPALLNRQLAEQFREGVAALAGELAAFAVDHRVPESPDYRLQVRETVNLGTVLEERLKITAADLGEQAATAAIGMGTGVVVAKGLGALVVKKGVAKVAGGKTVQLAAALLAKLVVKMAAKGGGAGAAATAGALICSPTGPGALLCGAIAGAVTWLLVDEAFIAFDEAVNREAFEGEIRQALLDQREELKSQLKAVYRQAVSAQYAELQGQFEMQRPRAVERTFVPARADGQR